MPQTAPSLHLAVALDGAGWHPAAGAPRPGAPAPPDVLSASYWTALAREAEAGLLDFLTIEDSLGPPPGAGRLDAVLIAARVAPLTSHIGLVPTALTSHTEPFHLSTSLATLDYASEGRAGWRVRVSSSAADARLFGRRDFPEFTRAERGRPDIARHIGDRFDEAADYVEAVRRLWDSWEDDAVIRDVPTGRFIDRDKLHYIDFEGEWFSVRGPSITPRPPSGQPVVVALAHNAVPYAFAARAADIVFITPRDRPHAAEIISKIKSVSASQRARRRDNRGERVRGTSARTTRACGGSERPEASGEALRVWADVTVFIDGGPGAAAARRRQLDEALPGQPGAEYVSDSAIAAGTPDEIADLLLDWREAGLDGFRLRPGALPRDLERITRDLVPELQRRGVFRTAYAERTLRERLGLPRAVNRYEVASA
jgi:alkanesulfonate monooxygenase SsuD/methylene tetrahydromethanopterin reductase-like flavin-dependent oxidoreductase (luciferase family)